MIIFVVVFFLLFLFFFFFFHSCFPFFFWCVSCVYVCRFWDSISTLVLLLLLTTLCNSTKLSRLYLHTLRGCSLVYFRARTGRKTLTARTPLLLAVYLTASIRTLIRVSSVTHTRAHTHPHIHRHVHILTDESVV